MKLKVLVTKALATSLELRYLTCAMPSDGAKKTILVLRAGPCERASKEQANGEQCGSANDAAERAAPSSSSDWSADDGEKPKQATALSLQVHCFGIPQSRMRVAHAVLRSSACALS